VTANRPVAELGAFAMVTLSGANAKLTRVSLELLHSAARNNPTGSQIATSRGREQPCVVERSRDASLEATRILGRPAVYGLPGR
jgi:hypothetical protein